MEQGNVLIIGNSGVGKSTLINAVLGEEKTVTGYGIAGTTKELAICESQEVPLRLIDTIGFEPTFFKERLAVNAVKKWARDSARKGNENTQINVIWFCVEGTAGNLFPKTIQNLIRATSLYPSVPVIAVITKSYSVPERERNIAMVQKAFATQKKYANNLPVIIPVVAETYVIQDDTYAPPAGISKLIDATYALMPEGKKRRSWTLPTLSSIESVLWHIASWSLLPLAALWFVWCRFLWPMVSC